MWSDAQKQRLRLEREGLRRYKWGFTFYAQNGSAHIEGWQSTCSGVTQCKLKLNIPPAYPYEEPELFVTFPNPLPAYDLGDTVNDYGTSHQFHTLTDESGGCVQICFIEDWDSSKSCLWILDRAALWLEAYELYRDTGMSIAEILDMHPTV